MCGAGWRKGRRERLKMRVDFRRNDWICTLCNINGFLNPWGVFKWIQNGLKITLRGNRPLGQIYTQDIIKAAREWIMCKPSEICLEWKALKVIKLKLKPAVWRGVVAFIISGKLEGSLNKQFDLRINFNFIMTFVGAGVWNSIIWREGLLDGPSAELSKRG